ncbi:MAG: plastocyanin/azurin family copper-binding protein, partial [Nitrososphaera sp.]|nr:plastocyanin/azurin family copper-binding protein [Nitrososphaera sp.]
MAILSLATVTINLDNQASAASINVSIRPGSSTMTNDAYSPNPVVANAGDTVIWTNKDSTPHTATSGTALGGATGMFGGTSEEIAIIGPSKTQSFTFTQAGDFPYYCVLHPSMAGVVKVTAAPVSLTVETDKSQYQSGETVTISGSTSGVPAGDNV